MVNWAELNWVMHTNYQPNLLNFLVILENLCWYGTYKFILLIKREHLKVLINCKCLL